MANNFTLTRQSSKDKKEKKKINVLQFISWSPYPQLHNKKTELINRIGSNETIVQTLYESSTPSMGMSTYFATTYSDVLEKATALSSFIGSQLQLKDNINNITYDNLVITDLSTTIKKVANGWLLIASFAQHIRIAPNEG
jgi:hypothetical protein